jgi:addiction module HigA family antidote
VTEGAKVLGVTRQALNNVVNGKAGISPGMAIRLAKAFGSTAETWLRMQLAYDLAAARKDESKIKVRRDSTSKNFTQRERCSCRSLWCRGGNLSWPWVFPSMTNPRSIPKTN